MNRCKHPSVLIVEPDLIFARVAGAGGVEAVAAAAKAADLAKGIALARCGLDQLHGDIHRLAFRVQRKRDDAVAILRGRSRVAGCRLILLKVRRKGHILGKVRVRAGGTGGAVAPAHKVVVVPRHGRDREALALVLLDRVLQAALAGAAAARQRTAAGHLIAHRIAGHLRCGGRRRSAAGRAGRRAHRLAVGFAVGRTVRFAVRDRGACRFLGAGRLL